jgi:hypothetical protein
VCVVVLSLYWTMNSVMSSLIVGTFKSACNTLFAIYHGAFAVSRRTLIWCLCNISMFQLVAVPQRGTPFVQSIHVYIYMYINNKLHYQSPYVLRFFCITFRELWYCVC